MQIRYLEAMQAMAKSANSKVIFLPGAAQNMAGALNAALTNETGNPGESGSAAGNMQDFGGQDFQQAVNARIVEHF